jgi:hypothetical protein
VAVGSFVFPWTFATIVLMSEVYGIPSGFRLALFDTMALSLASICFLVASNIPAATPRSPFVVAFNTLYTVDVPTLAVVNVAFAGGLMAAVVLLYVLGTLTTRRLVLSRFWLAPAVAQIVTRPSHSLSCSLSATCRTLGRCGTYGSPVSRSLSSSPFRSAA